MTLPIPCDRRIAVGDLEIAVRLWGKEGDLPVLATHGWWDNAASFDLLAPCLAQRGLRIAALDLPGHGHSAPRPRSAPYDIWNDLPEMLGLANQLGWDKFSLIGHSRGAFASVLLAAAQPERIAALVALDGLMPLPFKPEDLAVQLGKFLDDQLRERGELRSFDSLQEAARKRRAAFDMPERAAERILARSTRRVEGGYAWRSDRRVNNASAIKFDENYAQAYLSALRCPTLALMADLGLASIDMSAHFACVANLQRVVIANASHHFHMQPELLEQVSELIAAHLLGASDSARQA